MELSKIYDETDVDDILKFARRLEAGTISTTNLQFGTLAGALKNDSNSLLYGDKEYHGKGNFGQALEEVYFGKKNDTLSEPDFNKAKLELKVSPLIRLKNNQIRVKERLVLNHFRYVDIDKEVFEQSHFLSKDALILLVFYFYSKEHGPEMQEVDLVDIWECMKEDGDQIEADWNTIVKKVHDGKAEEISEGDTLFLGACTKGTTRDESLQTQPHSRVLAPGRALCFKQSYMNKVFRTLTNRKLHRKETEQRFITKPSEAFQDRIVELTNPYLGKDCAQISKMFGLQSQAKSKFALLARMMMGFSRAKQRFYEFDAANIQIKTIRVEKNGRIRESMSFKPIVYTEIVNQEWEDSDFYQELISKFIFVIFRKTDDELDYYLSDIKFWNMPEKDIMIVRHVWERTKACVAEDDFSNLPKIREHLIAHVRPHAKNKNDMMETPSGRFEYKRSFWLNNDYIQTHIVDGII